MALSQTGYITLGDNITGRSIAKELNDGPPNYRNTISLGDGNVRALAQRTSGSISMSHLRGKSSVETQTVTVGYRTSSGYITITSYGYYNSPTTSYGSISDGTLGPVGNKTIRAINWTTLNFLSLQVLGSASNSGWSYMRVNNTNFYRSSATFNSSSTATSWTWTQTTTNPFGSSGTKLVTFP